MVGPDWLAAFMKRNGLSVPEATSIARQAGFNKPSVESFFGNLREAMDRYVGHHHSFIEVISEYFQQ